MKKETKTVIYDECLKIEAYRFEGIVQPFPNHFHTYYVIGFVESGQRKLSCRNKEYNIRHGDIVLFGPGDNHACVQSDGGTLDYRGINLSQEVMRKLAEEITGVRELPGFSQNVIRDEEIGCYLKTLHEIVIFRISVLEKQKNYWKKAYCRRKPRCERDSRIKAILLIISAGLSV